MPAHHADEGVPKGDYLGSQGRRTGRQGRAVGELPDFGKVWRSRRSERHGEGARWELELQQRRDERDPQQQRLGRRNQRFYLVAKPGLDHHAAVVGAIILVVIWRLLGLLVLATGKEFEAWQALQTAMHRRQPPDGQQQQQTRFAEPTHGG